MSQEKKKGRMMLAAVMAMVVRYSTRKHLKLLHQDSTAREVDLDNDPTLDP
jgi:hypothetical protein